MKTTAGSFVSWAPYVGRSQGFIDALGLVPLYIHYLKLRKPIYALLKYPPQFITTLRRLFKIRPDIVFVMDPPVFAPLAVYFYCMISGSRYVMDCHSGVFESVKWRWSLPLQKFLARRAAAVLITNFTHQKIISSWQAKPIIMSDPPPPSAPSNSISHNLNNLKDKKPFIVLINRFGKDEPLEEILEAARRLPHVFFYITGDISRARPKWLNQPPSNVIFTGWLSKEDFWLYLQSANAILTLTNQENTMLRGAWESMFIGQPLITSNTSTLRNYFTNGTVFVENTPDDISIGIKDCLNRESKLRAGMQALKENKHLIWEKELQDLEGLLNTKFTKPSHQQSAKGNSNR